MAGPTFNTPDDSDEFWESTGYGAAGGAAMGSQFGPVGALFGAGAGGVMGMFGLDMAGDNPSNQTDAYGGTGNPGEAAAQQLDAAQGTSSQFTPSLQYEYYTPDMAYQTPAAAYAYADPEAVNAQYAALDQLQEWGKGGLTATDMANMNQSQMNNAQAERASREAYMNQLQQRGMGGSGAELAGVMSGMQGQMNANAQEAIAMQVAAQERALRATEGAGNLSSGIRGSSFSEAYNRGSVWDEFNRGNTDYQRDLQQRNVETANEQERARVAGSESLWKQEQAAASLRAGQPIIPEANPFGDALQLVAGGAENWNTPDSEPEQDTSKDTKRYA